MFEEEFTETGAFAGPGYVEMPQSRVGKFFGKFRRKKEKKEESAHEWLGVDEDFDARSAGKARGSWESFREDDDEWQGGAFGSLKARLPKNDQDEEGAAEASRGSEHRQSVPAVSSDAFAAALAAANAAAEASGNPVVSEDVHQPHEEDIQEIYSFAAGDINTEVWFVALGSDLAGNGGIKAFLADRCFRYAWRCYREPRGAWRGNPVLSRKRRRYQAGVLLAAYEEVHTKGLSGIRN